MSDEKTRTLPGISTQTSSKAQKTPANTTICNVNDYQSAAKSVLPKPLYEYISSGTDDEQTLAENSYAFKQWYLRPRVLKPVSLVSASTSLFGKRLSLPVFTSPAGVQALCDEEGECATARACARVGTMFGLSQHATRSIEDVARGAPGLENKWFQAYILKDRDVTVRLVKRALEAGYNGIFVTVDSARFGYREADARNGFNALPPPHRLVNYDEPSTASHLDSTYNKGEQPAWDQNTEQLFDQDSSWEDISLLKRLCGNVPLVVKGIMTAEDAVLAVRAGADGVMVSNHGGRQLDGCLSSIDALPEVVRAVGGKVPVLLDGGVRRGTDVLKALALGATAVGVGKPVFYALACGGEEAVVNMLQMFKTEIEAAMAICGCRTIEDVKPELVTRHPSGSPLARYTRSKL